MVKTRIIHHLKGAAKRCRADERGVAAVEFALILPVMLLLLLGSIEMSERLYQSSRAVQAASIMGDLITQASSGTLNDADLDDFYSAMRYALDPFADSRVKIHIADYRVDPSDDTKYVIAWTKQKGSLDKTSCKVFKESDLPSHLKAIVLSGTDIVATRVCWEFTSPLKKLGLLNFLDNVGLIKHDVFLRPRESNTIELGS